MRSVQVPSSFFLIKSLYLANKYLHMKYEFSAGGIVFRKHHSVGSGQAVFDILLCQHSGHHKWVLPKGLIGDTHANEEKEQTALREVEEETGAQGKILHALTPVTHWYQWKGEKRKKTVYYFLMKYIGGDITKHDWEMEDVRWIPMEEVEKWLAFKSEKQAWNEAKEWLMKQ
jgi:8-oxo-dGTP diphosphatase